MDPEADGPRTGGIARTAELARRLATRVRLLGAMALLAAFTLWSVLFYPFGFAAWWHWALAVLTLGVLAAPSVVFLLVHMALHALIGLPGSLRTAVSASRDRTARATGALQTRRRWWMGRTAWELWRLVVENRELLLGSVGLVRLVNPVSLAVVAVAMAITPVLMIAALIALAVVLL